MLNLDLLSVTSRVHFSRVTLGGLRSLQDSGLQNQQNTFSIIKKQKKAAHIGLPKILTYSKKLVTINGLTRKFSSCSSSVVKIQVAKN